MGALCNVGETSLEEAVSGLCASMFGASGGMEEDGVVFTWKTVGSGRNAG